MKHELSHTDSEGKARMVDVGNKPEQKRTAVAEGFIRLSDKTLKLISENKIPKGDVLTLARIAGIQAAKRTSELIPLCHPLFISLVDIQEEILEDGVKLQATVKTNGRTGVEMEALIAVSAGLLTIYDMCKSVDARMEIGQIKLLEKKKEQG
jgi:cyclic pyranopterin phosphate synthase